MGTIITEEGSLYLKEISTRIAMAKHAFSTHRILLKSGLNTPPPPGGGGYSPNKVYGGCAAEIGDFFGEKSLIMGYGFAEKSLNMGCIVL